MIPRRRLSDLLARAGVHPLAPPGPDPEILGIELDSRSIETGGLFLALPGTHRHGDEFVADALARGARAILAPSVRPSTLPEHVAWVRVADPRPAAGLVARELYGRPDESLRLVGITGTNGKTTVTYLVESIARAAGGRVGRIGTVAYSFEGAEQSAPRTTPEAPDLYRLLADMRERGADLVAMEVSSHALELSRTAGARFAVAALVSFGRDHLDFHGTLERYFEAKARLFEGLDPGSVAVLPHDEAAGGALAQRTRARVLTFGRSEGASLRIANERSGFDGSTADLHADFGVLRVRTSLIGRFNLDNVAAAALCALAAGCPPQSIQAGVAALARVPGRVEPVVLGQPFAVLVDYAHTPDALARLLSAAREIASGRILLVFGCGGDRDRGKRPEMGRIAAQGADLVFATSDNPRGEEPASILRDVERGIVAAGGRGRCRILEDRSLAVRAAIESARPEDAVLVVGKGHETTQTLGDRTLALDDRELAREALESLGFGRRGSRARA